MAVPYFVNNNPYEIGVPAISGQSIQVPPGKYVGGEYYQDLVYIGILTEYVGTPPPQDVVYIYQLLAAGESSGGGGDGDITAVIAGTGLSGGGTTGSVTLNIATGGITADMIADGVLTADLIDDGQVVKSLNGLFDNITFAAGSNITLTPVGQTITIAAPTIGVTTVDSDLPLTLELTDGGANIHGEINITTTNNGGAVALQTVLGSAVVQTGFAYLNELLLNDYLAINNAGSNKVLIGDNESLVFVKNVGTDDQYFFRAVDSDNVDLFSVDWTGKVTTPELDVATANFDSVTFGPDVSGTDIALSKTAATFDVPVTFKRATTILNTGADVGQLVGSTGTRPLIDLVANSASIYAMEMMAGVSNAKFLNFYDTDGTTSLFSFGQDGIFNSEIVNTNKLQLNAQIVTVGAYDLGVLPNTVFICNAIGGAITFTLPELTSDFPSGVVYIFKKDDVSGNGVLISPTSGQLIDGVTSKLISTNLGVFRVMSVVLNDPIPTAKWITW